METLPLKSLKSNLKVYTCIPFLRTGKECEKYLSEAIKGISNQKTTVEILPVRIDRQGKRRDTQKVKVAKTLNFFADEFLKTDSTHIFIGNADTTYPEDMIERLIRLDVDLASGISPGHADWNNIVVGTEKDTGGIDWLRRDDIVGQVIGEYKVVMTGNYCILAKRRVFERHFKDQNPLRWRTEKEHGRRLYGAELQFWVDAQEMRFKTLIDGNVVCGHLPEWPLSYEGHEDMAFKKIRAQKWTK